MAEPIVVDPDDIITQRQRGWPDWHPERYCHRCGMRNVWSWWVDSDLWNQATEEMEWGAGTILCPQCFTEAWEAATGQSVSWQLSIDPATASGMSHPGRTVNDEPRQQETP